MKIHQLPDGARFEYEGEEYVKTGPLIGTGPNGPRLIPRYAVLKPLNPATAPAPAPKPETVSRATVLQAFDAFHAECQWLVGEEGRPALEAARRRFLESLD